MSFFAVPDAIRTVAFPIRSRKQMRVKHPSRYFSNIDISAYLSFISALCCFCTLLTVILCVTGWVG